MSLEALGVPYAAFKRPDWVLAVVATAVIVVVAWESWETNKGNNRPVLNVAVGIMLSLLAGMSVERGIGHFRSGTSNYRWIFEVLMGLASLVMSILYFMRQKGRPRPRGIIEWLYERDKPPLMFDKKDH